MDKAAIVAEKVICCIGECFIRSLIIMIDVLLGVVTLYILSLIVIKIKESCSKRVKEKVEKDYASKVLIQLNEGANKPNATRPKPR